VQNNKMSFFFLTNELSYLEYVYVGDDIDRGVGGVTKAII
jgi:hypothetical protein